MAKMLTPARLRQSVSALSTPTMSGIRSAHAANWPCSPVQSSLGHPNVTPFPPSLPAPRVISVDHAGNVGRTPLSKWLNTHAPTQHDAATLSRHKSRTEMGTD